MRKRITQIVCVPLVALALVYPLWYGGFLENWENKARDTVSRLLAEPSPHTDDIILILVDQQSLDWVNDNLGISWPWPRELHSAVINECTRRGAIALGIDVIFSEPSIYGVGDDAKLAEAIKQTKALALGSVSAGKVSGSRFPWPASWPNRSINLDRSKAAPLPFPTYPKAVAPIDEIARSADVLCNVSQVADGDGIFRWIYPLSLYEEVVLPSLGVGVYLATNQNSSLAVTDNSLELGSHFMPIDTEGRTSIRFRGPGGKTYLSFSAAPLIQTQILLQQGETPAPETQQEFSGKYVFYGFSAPGLRDLRPTPLGGKTPGVELHATVLDNLLAGDFLKPVPAQPQSILIACAAILLATLFVLLSRPLYQVALFLLSCSVPILCLLVSYRVGDLIQYLPLQLSMLLVAILSVFASYMTVGRQRRFIQHSFKHYLSPAVIEQLIHDPDRLRLGGERKELTIFFSDLQGFTSISEKLEPEMLTELLNRYLTAMTDIILSEGGTVDKYEGDAIIAFWNAPLSVPDHGPRAVSAAIRCQEELKRLQSEFVADFGHSLRMRIGINSGTAVVGNFGSSKRFDYTMLGDAVNLAARLEGVNKQFGTGILISQTTRDLLPEDFPLRKIAMVAVVGRREPVAIYEPMSCESYDMLQNDLAVFEAARQAYSLGNFAEAIRLFSKIADTDPVAAPYLEVCRNLNEKTAGLANWKGIWKLSEK